MVRRPTPPDRFTDLCRWLTGDEAPELIHVRGGRELRRAVTAVALTGAPTRIVASLPPDATPSPVSLWRRADVVLVDSSARGEALRAGLEPTRLREDDSEAAFREVLDSARRRVAYRRRLERRNRVRRALR